MISLPVAFESPAAWAGCAVMAVCCALIAARRLRGVATDLSLFYDIALWLIGISVVTHALVALNVGNYYYAPHQPTLLPRNLEWMVTSPLFLLAMAEMAARLRGPGGTHGDRLLFGDIGAAVLSTASVIVWLFSVFAHATNRVAEQGLFLCTIVGFAVVALYVLRRRREALPGLSPAARGPWRAALVWFVVFWASYPLVYQCYLWGLIDHTTRVSAYIILDIAERGGVTLALLNPVLLRDVLQASQASQASQIPRGAGQVARGDS